MLEKKKEKKEEEEEETQLPTPSTRAAKHSIRNSLAASPEEAFDLSSWHNNNQACRVKRVHLFITLPQMHDVAAGECAAAKNPTSPSTRPLLNLSNPSFSFFDSIFSPSHASPANPKEHNYVLPLPAFVNIPITSEKKHIVQYHLFTNNVFLQLGFNRYGKLALVQ